jgi:hypothetical protein
MKQPERFARDRRSFLRNAGLGGGVPALGPLGAALAREADAAPTAGGRQFVLIQADHGHDSKKEKGAANIAFALPQKSHDLSAF